MVVGEKPKKDDNAVKLEWRDYVAIAIAAFQTTLLPIVIFLGVLALILLLLLLP